jgi:hypothetical protein
MRAEPEQQQNVFGETIPAPVEVTHGRHQTAVTYHILLHRFCQMRGDCTIWQETCGSGAVTGTEATTAPARQIRQVQNPVPIAFYGEAHGLTAMTHCDPLQKRMNILASADTAISASVV